MPSGVFRTPQSIPAGGNLTNILEGSRFELPTRPTRVQMYATSSNSDVTFDVFFGSRLIGQDLTPNVNASGLVKQLEDQMIDDFVLPSERIVIKAKNSNAAAQTLVPLIKFTEV